MKHFHVFIFLAMLCAAAPSRAEVLNVDLAQNHVDITTGFTGAQLVLFGVKEQPGDIAIVIRGPEHTMLVRRKDEILGAWVNTHSMKFRSVPSYFDYAMSTPEDKLASAAMLKTLGIGLNALHFEPDRRRESDEYVQNFQEALIRNKQKEGLFPIKPRDVIFLSSNFFRAGFHLPANVPTGNYEVLTFLFQKGQPVMQKTTYLRVAQVGLGARIYRFAYKNGFVYGLLCVSLAIIAGFVVNLVGRRDP